MISELDVNNMTEKSTLKKNENNKSLIKVE